MNETSSAAQPQPGQASRLFLPLIDNGQGDIKANFLLCCIRGFASRDIHIERFSDSLVPRARNRAAAAFLRSDRDYILFIDGDIVFDPSHIDGLMESDDPILAGLYCKKSREVEPCLNTIPELGNQPVGGLIEIARAGTGFLRIARHVLEAMKERDVPSSSSPAGDVSSVLRPLSSSSTDWRFAPHYINHGIDEWDFFPTGVKNREYLSEDWYFCDRARALGFKVMLDSRIQAKHEGITFYPTEEAIERRLAAERQLASASASKVEITETGHNGANGNSE